MTMWYSQLSFGLRRAVTNARTDIRIYHTL